jgi:NAD-dependent dihydropyrimidine dehydrogenase PreA subunit
MELKYLKNITDLILDPKLCTGCGMCVQVCPHNVFEIRYKKAFIMDKDDCMQCGACKLNCPFNAINVSSGVGCAYAVYFSALTKNPPTCGPAETTAGCGCGPAEPRGRSGRGCCG